MIITKEIIDNLVAAYRYCDTQGEAIEKVKDKFPECDLNILWAMWSTIDIYLDLYGTN